MLRQITDLIDAATGHTKRRPATRSSTSRQKRRAEKLQGSHSFTVQKAYCTPAKAVILQSLNTYGVPVSNYKERVLGAEVGLPIAQQATFTVPAQQANWAEYLMERTGELAVVGGRIDGRNREWAFSYDGKMPKPWIEPDCAEGHKAWRERRR